MLYRIYIFNTILPSSAIQGRICTVCVDCLTPLSIPNRESINKIWFITWLLIKIIVLY